jgi:hypothetical protein
LLKLADTKGEIAENGSKMTENGAKMSENGSKLPENASKMAKFGPKGTKITLLDYIVSILGPKAEFYKEFGSLKAAVAVALPQVAVAVAELQRGVRMIGEELETVGRFCDHFEAILL